MKILSLVTIMSFQTCKTSVHLQNTNQDIFLRAFWLSIDSKDITMINAQKRSKYIWHQAFNLNFTKLREYFLYAKKTITLFIQQLFSPSYCLLPSLRLPQNVISILYVQHVRAVYWTCCAVYGGSEIPSKISEFVFRRWTLWVWIKGWVMKNIILAINFWTVLCQ